MNAIVRSSPQMCARDEQEEHDVDQRRRLLLEAHHRFRLPGVPRALVRPARKRRVPGPAGSTSASNAASRWGTPVTVRVVGVGLVTSDLSGWFSGWRQADPCPGHLPASALAPPSKQKSAMFPALSPSGRRVSNPRPSALEADALPTE